MATRLYLHAAANAVSGTFPSGEQSTLTANVNGSGAATVKSMDSTIGPGSTDVTYTTLAQTTRQFVYLGMWVSPTFNVNQSVGGVTNITLNVADGEASLNSNAWVNQVNLYVWRPSTGAKVGTIRDFSGSSMGGTEPTAVSPSLQVTTFTFSNSAVSAQAGDVLICELWCDITQAMGSAYANRVQYDGITVNTSGENAVTTDNHASFIEFNETLTFGAAGGSAALAGALTCSTTATAALDIGTAIRANITTTVSASITGFGANNLLGSRFAAHQATSAGSGYSIGSVVYNTATKEYVAHGYKGSTFAGQVYKSTDGVNWTTTPTSPLDTSISDATYGNGYYIANSSSDTIWKSTDGITWTTQSLGNPRVFRGTFYANNGGTQVLGLLGGTTAAKVNVSSDATTWTEYSLPITPQAVGFGNGKFVAVSNDGLDIIAVSSDSCATWASKTVTGYYTAVAYGNGRWVAFGYISGQARSAYSTDNGLNWTTVWPITNIASSSSWTDMVYSDGYFIVSNSVAGQTAYSTDGITWTYTPSSVGSRSQAVGPSGIGSGDATNIYMLRFTGAQATLSGTLTNLPTGLNATAAAVATVTGGLTTQIKLAASRTVVAAVTGALTTQIKLAATPAVAVTATGDLSTGAAGAALAGTPTATATVTGALTTGIPLAGALAAAVATSGALTTQIKLAAAAAVTSSTSGALTTQIKLAGAAAGVATGAGALTTAIQMAGAAASVVTATAALTAPGAGITASIAAVATVAGALTTGIRLAGAGTVSAAVTGAISTQIQLAAARSVVVTATGALSTQVKLTAALTAVATATGALSTSIRLAAAQSTIATATGALSTQIKLAGSLAAATTVTGSLAGAGAALSAAPTVRATVTGSLSSPAAALAAQASCRAFLTGALTAASAINAKVLELVHTSAPTALVATTRTRALHSQAGAAPAVVVSTPTPSIHAMNQTVQLFVRRPAQDADLTSP